MGALLTYMERMRRWSDKTISTILELLRSWKSPAWKEALKSKVRITFQMHISINFLSFNTLIYIQHENVRVYTRIGLLYYYILSKYRKLSFLEKIKIKIYNLLFLIDEKPSF
jgi:hypothetical protein